MNQLPTTTRTPEQREQLRHDLITVLNQHGAENASNTPDFVLAEYLVNALETFEAASNAREKWYGNPGPEPALNPPEVHAVDTRPDLCPVHMNGQRCSLPRGHTNHHAFPLGQFAENYPAPTGDPEPYVCKECHQFVAADQTRPSPMRGCLVHVPDPRTAHNCGPVVHAEEYLPFVG